MIGTMRLFVGIDISDEIRERISDYMKSLEAAAPGTKWVRAESLHVTLKFIGESKQVEEIKQALNGVRGEALAISFCGTGFFTPRSPRVFWVGVEAGAGLQQLAASVEAALLPLGIEKETRDYSPHLTLAREGSGRPSGAPEDRNQADSNKTRMYALRRKVEADPKLRDVDFGTMQATEFFLYQSETRPEGAKYTKLERFALA
ncbi:MAG: RNA 2',3'-cyclic phosphodiesterase [Terriglobales bacterium]